MSSIASHPEVDLHGWDDPAVLAALTDPLAGGEAPRRLRRYTPRAERVLRDPAHQSLVERLYASTGYPKSLHTIDARVPAPSAPPASGRLLRLPARVSAFESRGAAA